MHYCQKFLARMGEWPPEMCCPIIDEHSDLEANISATDTEEIRVCHSYLNCIHSAQQIFTDNLQGISHTVLDTHKTRKQKHCVSSSNPESDKENLEALSTHKAKRPRKEKDNVVNLLQNAVELLHRAIYFSEEAIILLQTAVNLLDKGV